MQITYTYYINVSYKWVINMYNNTLENALKSYFEIFTLV